jgi:hypothetical protein
MEKRGKRGLNGASSMALLITYRVTSVSRGCWRTRMRVPADDQPDGISAGN